ncbi:hypothetical protein AU191_06685 [Mycolicibacterium acapulense]|nr:hypothetical protein AU191_06685 [Mycolicibacterium acapulense]
MEHWDYQTVLELAAPVSVDRRTVTEECQLEWDSGLAVLVMARSSHTNVEQLATRLDVPLSDTFDLAVELRLEGYELGGRLTLQTLLVCTTPKPAGPLAPRHSGSILWRSSHWTDLEGIGAQFPTDTVDFTQSARDSRAGWELRIDIADPEALFMSAARLTLNSGHPAIGKLLRGEKDEGTDQLRRTLNWDVTRQMVYIALQNDDVAVLEMDPHALSIAGVLRNLLATIWPLESVVTLRQWLETDPSRLERRLQDHCGLIQ